MQALDSTLPIIVMTAWSSIPTAVEAIRRGARDYVEKPWDNERLLATIRSQLELERVDRLWERWHPAALMNESAGACSLRRY